MISCSYLYAVHYVGRCCTKCGCLGWTVMILTPWANETYNPITLRKTRVYLDWLLRKDGQQELRPQLDKPRKWNNGNENVEMLR